MTTSMKSHLADITQIGGIIATTVGVTTLADVEIYTRIAFYIAGTVAVLVKLGFILAGCSQCPRIKGDKL